MYTIHIDSVDGTTFYHLTSDDKAEILQFLEKYDHEGSTVSLIIEVDNAENIYEYLRQE